MLEKLKPQDFDRVFMLLENSFPPDEYRTYEEHKALLDNVCIQFTRSMTE